MAGRLKSVAGFWYGLWTMRREPARVFATLHRQVRHPRARRALARLMGMAAEPAPDRGNDPVSSRWLGELCSQGMTAPLGILDPEAARAMWKAAEARPCFDVYRRHLGTFAPDAAPPDTHVAHLAVEDVVRLPGLLRHASDPRVLATVEAYLEHRVTIDRILVWWSFPGKADAEEAQRFHRDADLVSWVNHFTYLGPVDLDTGPHVFVRGSHRSAELSEDGRHSDEEVTRRFGSAVTPITGPAGTGFLADTYALHKGSLPRTGRRLMAQVTYCVFASGLGEPKQPVLDAEEATRLVGGPFDPHLLRRFVRAPGGAGRA